MQILAELKAPVKMMVGEHDWFYDMGDAWQEMFGPPNYSFDWKGVHVVVLMSVHEKDFWTARKMTPEQRMHTVAGLDNGIQSRFEVGDDERKWLSADLAKVPHTTPLLVFSHSPLYKYYRNWNFWTDDAEQVQAILKPYNHVTVIHGHTHQMLYQPDREHQFLRDALDGVAVAVRSDRAAAVDYSDEPGGSVRSVRRTGRRPDKCARRRIGGQDLQPVGSQPGHGEGRLPGFARQDRAAARATVRELLRAGEKLPRGEYDPTIDRIGNRRRMRGDICGRDARAAASRATSASAACPSSAGFEKRRHGRDALRRQDQRGSERPQAGRVDDSCAGSRGHAPVDGAMAARASEREMGDGAGRPVVSAATSSVSAAGAPSRMAKATAAKPQSKGTQQGDTYASFTDRDYKVWKNETDNFVEEGKQLFHDGAALGGTIGVSCDMCHPDASNTHPETYPKYQVQLQRVALLRDMIDWCIENPAQGQGARSQRSETARARSVYPRAAQRRPRSTTASTKRSAR